MAKTKLPAKMPVDELRVKKAEEILRKYMDAKKNLDRRIVENDKWYRMRHWEQIRGNTDAENKKPEPTSAWLFNSLNNKHADIMDNFPEPQVIPREQSDKQDAEMISNILPVIFERCNFKKIYSRNGWVKLQKGFSIYGTFWNKRLENGLGDIDIRKINPLNFFWEPGIEDIQESANIFNIALVDKDVLLRQYPQLADKLGESPSITLAQYEHDDTIDTSEKAAVVDWYYKQTVEDANGQSRDILHFCKYCNGVVLYATENDPELSQTGLYDHGKYPFTMDVLFPEEDTPAGFGYVDVIKDPQLYIDKLDQIIELNASASGNPRVLASTTAGINRQQFLDPTNTIVDFTGALDERTFRPLEVHPLNNFIVEHRQAKIDELKETSNNRDFSQGGTASGVTAASAIAALQEAGSKTSRDNIQESYNAMADISYLCIELMRQFYTEPRMFRIVGENGKESFQAYDNSRIVEQQIVDPLTQKASYRRPIFDIEVRAQKASPFSTVAKNAQAQELYAAQFFNPQNADQALIALDMMDFEGKESVVQKISQNSMIMQIAQEVLRITAEQDLINGTQYSLQLAQLMGVQMPQPQVQSGGSGGAVQTNALGSAVQSSQRNTSTKAQERAANVAAPK